MMFILRRRRNQKIPHRPSESAATFLDFRNIFPLEITGTPDGCFQEKKVRRQTGSWCFNRQARQRLQCVTLSLLDRLIAAGEKKPTVETLETCSACPRGSSWARCLDAIAAHRIPRQGLYRDAASVRRHRGIDQDPRTVWIAHATLLVLAACGRKRLRLSNSEEARARRGSPQTASSDPASTVHDRRHRRASAARQGMLRAPGSSRSCVVRLAPPIGCGRGVCCVRGEGGLRRRRSFRSGRAQKR